VSKYNWIKKMQKEKNKKNKKRRNKKKKADKNVVCHGFYLICTERTLSRKLLKGSGTSNARKCTSHCEICR
jgi:endonuclease IV